jgi:hypothetical protein
MAISTQGNCVAFAGKDWPYDRQTLDPQQSPLRVKPYWRRCIWPIHAFLPTVTFFQPHSGRLAAAKLHRRQEPSRFFAHQMQNPSRRLLGGGMDGLECLQFIASGSVT